jgi:hypothetical protein
MKPDAVKPPVAMKPPPNFNRMVRAYKWMELATFGPWLWRCRCAFIDKLGASRRALILGDGDGRFTARLLTQNPGIEIDAVDASHAMLQALVHRAGASAHRIRTHWTDARVFEPSLPACDLIVTHFFLDCLTTDEVAALAARLRKSITPSVIWLISEFAVPKGWFGRLVACPAISALYFAFWLLTGLSVRQLPDYSGALINAGFTRIRKHEWLAGLLVSELWALQRPGADSSHA